MSDGRGNNPEDCVEERSGEPDGGWDPFDQFADSYAPKPIPRVVGADGMPTPALADPISDIPALSPDTLVCMERTERFVLRNVWGDVMAEFTSDEAERAPNGRWRAKREIVVERMKMEAQRVRAYCKKHVESGTDPTGDMASLMALSDPDLIFTLLPRVNDDNYAVNRDWMEVFPVRPRCEHYVRQMMQTEFGPEHPEVYRLCAARRSTEGAMMGVGEVGVYSCDMRSPPDPDTLQRVDDFDRTKIEQGKQRTYLPMFEDTGIFSENRGTNG
jgi:hypothetical protein